MRTPQGIQQRVLAVWWRGLRHEVVHARRLRRALLCAELRGWGVAHTSGGDAVTVRMDGLWFDVYAWLREDASLTWVVDHPHTELDDEYPGHEIGRCRGFRFPLDQLPVMWARYLGVD